MTTLEEVNFDPLPRKPLPGYGILDIARWIELPYNKTRLHSTLGCRTPQRFWTSI
jgi:hypothetical protein